MIIFDFDQTLVDTRSTEHLRKSRRWREVMQLSSDLTPYPGVTEMLKELGERGQDLAIVTNSPNMIPKAFAARYSWPISGECILGFHQVPSDRRKPDPEGLLRALSLSGPPRDHQSHYHVGDAPEDTVASQRAEIVSLGAGWGCESLEDLRQSAPDHLFLTVSELHEFLILSL